jgi:predicted nucleic acid-binding protein
VTHQHPPRAILDADILYSRVLYEFMGRIATGMRELNLVWSDQLIDEATRVLRTRKGLPGDAAERWVSYLQTAFPAGRVDINDALADDTLSGLTNAPDDLHVCALAIASKADYLFTADRGYLRDKLANIGVTTMHPTGSFSSFSTASHRQSSTPSKRRLARGRAAAASQNSSTHSNAPVQHNSLPRHAVHLKRNPPGQLPWAMLG